MNPLILGFIRGIGMVVLLAILSYFGDASHLSQLTSAGVASLVASIALAIEHGIEAKTGKALFGAVRIG